ncbi:hypothetical protein NKI31_26745 [Mesorhizobium sp. M0659]|uniref:hypothetical protein n=1 Tax=Mesorhizobium sp. M0659 TaxID=2956980 RepID=UPI00333D444D
MIVEDQLDRRIGRISCVEKFEEFDELAAAMTLLNQGVDLPGEQIDPRQKLACHGACTHERAKVA